MGLWLKCPGCQAQNPLPMKVCPHCGQDLDKLSAAQRVYVMGPAPALPQVAGPATARPPVPAAVSQPVKPSPAAGATPKPAKKTGKARKKKG
jgi:hypothetical protein